MKAFTLLSAMVFGMFTSYAQQNFSGAKKNSITGKVFDKTTSKAVEYATISLHNSADSSLVTGTTAAQDGSFVLQNLEEGSYFMRTGFVGFKTKITTGIQVTAAVKNLDLGVISLESSMENLAEVQVTAEKRQMETLIDKKIFNVDKTPAAAGGDGLEVLRNVPTVDVDVDGNISLRGESNVNILVDGRPLNMSASQYLQSVPASSIEKIELITNPSAKYDPEGTSGIINIIMKKDRKGGLNGNINSSIGYGRYPKSNNSLALNYRTGKWNIQSSGSVNYSKSWFGGENIRDIDLAGNSFYQTTVDNGFNENVNIVGKLGTDYYLNDKTTLYLSGTLVSVDGIGERNFTYQNFDGERTFEGASDRTADLSYPVSSFTLNGGFQHKFKKEGSTLDLDMNYSENNTETNEVFAQLDGNASNEVFDSYQQIQDNTEKSKVWNSRLDYVLPLSDSSIFEAGFHTTLRDFDNDLFFATDSLDGNGAIPNSNLNNRFLYSEEVLAFYSTISRDFKKWSAKGGLRYESTVTEGILVNTLDTGGVNYHSLFPSAYLSYKLTEGKSLQASYTRRINRPSEGQLNPFTSYSDQYTIRTGNPFLRPEYIDVYEIGYNSYGKKVNINASIYMRQTNDRIGRFLELDTATGINIVLFKNFDKSYVYGTELILTYTPFDWWKTTTSFNFWQIEFDKESFLEDNLNYTNYGYSLMFQSTHNLSKDFMLQWNIRHRGRMQVLQGEITPMTGVDISARKNILKGKGSLSLRVSDLFNTRQFGFESIDLGNYQYETTRRWESQTVYLSFNYSFGKADYGNRRRRRSNFNNGGGNAVPSTGL